MTTKKRPEIHPFTAEAIRRARADELNASEFREPEPLPKQAHPLHLMVDEDDLILLNQALDCINQRATQFIKRAENFPSETIRSSITIDKYRKIQEHVKHLRSRIAEEAQW